MNFNKLAKQTEAYIIEQRRWCHRHPELSWEEVRTTDHIVQELTAMGYEVHRFPEHPGCWALLQGGKAQADCKTILLRADIDALPVEEKTGLPFASENPGVMHACGHDNHIAMLLGAAKMLMSVKDELEGNVKFFFQSAEETGCGALYYVEQGITDGVDAAVGMHIWGTLEAPYINFQPGNRMASMDTFKITVEGVSAHGTQPHLGADALVAASAIVMNLQTLISRSNDPVNPLVVNVGEMHAGQRFNIVANKAELFGTVRTYNGELRNKMAEHIRRIAENTAAVFGAKATVDYQCYCNAVINDDDELTAVAQNAVTKLYGPESMKELPAMMGGEDFAYLAEKVPAVFGYIGSKNEALGLTAANHNDHYTTDESVLKRGAAAYAQIAADFLACPK